MFLFGGFAKSGVTPAGGASPPCSRGKIKDTMSQTSKDGKIVSAELKKPQNISDGGSFQNQIFPKASFSQRPRADD